MNVGFGEILLILIIVLILFGAGKLPKVMGDLGRGVRAMREGMKEDDKPEDASKE